MAATIENGSGNGEISTSSTCSLTVTSGNRAAVCVATEGAGSHDAVDRNSQSFTQIGSTITHNAGGTTTSVSFWEVANPSVGTFDVNVTTSTGTIRIGVVAYSLVGAAAAQAATGSSTGTTSPRTATFTIDTADSLLMDVISCGQFDEAMTADGAQTEHQDFTSGGSGAADRCRVGSSSKVTTSGSQSMQWTADDGTFSLRCAYLAVAFPPSAAPSGGGGAYYRKRRSISTGGRGL